MNIYCVIFMCTFGANNTDTEIAMNNSLIEGPSNSNITGIKSGPAITHADVASMILPERGEHVPQMGDIVMELPKVHNDEDVHADSEVSSSDSPSNDASASSDSQVMRLTLSDILLPPSAQARNQVDSQ